MVNALGADDIDNAGGAGDMGGVGDFRESADADEPGLSKQDESSRRRHPIEVESYRIMRSRVDFEHFPPFIRAVVERVVHTTADPSWTGEVVADEAAVRAGRAALLGGAALITDVRMVAAGVTAREAHVGLDHPDTSELAAREGLTRSAAGVRLMAEQHANGAVWAVGNAPTALDELLRLAGAGLEPALVIGVPVGFVGAVPTKAALRGSGLPAVSTLTERGGAAIASAVINALLYVEEPGGFARSGANT